MKKARLILTASMLTIFGFTAVTLSSCNKDETCPVGYEGKDCKELTRDKFLGDWQGEDKCDLGTYPIDLEIKASTTSEINATIVNPGGFGGTVTITGVVTDENTLTFTNQDLGGDRELSGKMVFIGNSMTFNYEVDGLVDDDSCVGTYTRL